MKRVLLLEDSSNVSDAVIGFLELRGIEVILARTVAEARAAYDPGLFDVLLVDYELPDGTGLDFLAEADREEAAVILWSGLDRSREVAVAGLDGIEQASKADMPDVLDHVVAKVSA